MKIGVTNEDFQHSGKVPTLSDSLKIINNVLDITNGQFFSRAEGTPSGPGPLFGFKLQRCSKISDIDQLELEPRSTRIVFQIIKRHCIDLQNAQHCSNLTNSTSYSPYYHTFTRICSIIINFFHFYLVKISQFQLFVLSLDLLTKISKKLRLIKSFSEKETRYIV